MKLTTDLFILIKNNLNIFKDIFRTLVNVSKGVFGENNFYGFYERHISLNMFQHDVKNNILRN